jgi:GAF domain-containing protein
MIGDTTITLLQRLFTLMNSAAGRHAIFSGAADSLLTLLEADSAAIFEHDVVQDSFVLATARNLSLDAQVQVMQALTRRVQASPVWISYPQTVCDWPQQLLAEEGSLAPGLDRLTCLMTMPLRSSKGELLGVMAAFYDDPTALNGRRQVMASLLAGLVAVSLENAELYEVERQRADFMAEVLRSGDVLQVDQSLDSIIQQVVEIISGTLGWQGVVVVVYDYEAGERRLAGWITKDPVFNERLERLPRSSR